MAPPFFNAHDLHLHFFHVGVMARILGLICMLAVLVPGSGLAAVGYWSGSYASCDSLQTKSFTTYVNCAVDQVEIDNPFASCPQFWGESTTPAPMTSGGVEIYRGDFIVWRNAFSGTPTPSCHDQIQRSAGSASMTLAHCVLPQVFDPEIGECYTPITEDCSEYTGQKKGVKWPDSGVNPGASLCKNVGSKSCTMTASAVSVCMGGSCYNTYSYSGAACTTPPPDPSVTEAAEGEKGECVGIQGGSVCTAYERDAQNCGTVNGQPLCLGKVPDGKCLFIGGTGVACDSSAGSPPAPDDGVTPGTPATPVAQIETRDAEGNVTNNYSVYSQTQVNNSTGGVTGSYADSSGTGSASGDGDGEGGGGSGSSSGSCAIEPPCEGDPIQCAILRQSWLSRCYEPVSDGEAGSLVGGPAGVGSEIIEIGQLDEGVFGLESGSCPADQEITVFGSAIALPWSFACQLAGYMRPLILLMAYLQSAYIVVGAFRNG